MIRLNLSVEPGVYFNGIELRFRVVSGKQQYTTSKHVYLEQLLDESLLDMVLADFGLRLKDAIAEHKRKCAGAEPVA